MADRRICRLRPVPYLLVCAVALIVSVLTFFSGFGLGTLLMPAFAVFFPLPVAIAATAVVHLANNLFKLGLVWKWAHWPTAVLYGVPAVIGSVAGAAVLAETAHLPPLVTYSLWGATRGVTAVKLLVAAMIGFFAVLELSPGFGRLSFPPALVPVGGIISGFFGGLSGHQGALRSAFLVRAGLTKEQFIGTRTVGAVLVDVPRIAVYALALGASDLRVLRAHSGLGLVLAASGAAFAGSYVGSKLVTSVTMRLVRRVVGVGLLLTAAALGAGLV
jgi:uncharacterized membrane protein YfcA